MIYMTRQALQERLAQMEVLVGQSFLVMHRQQLEIRLDLLTCFPTFFASLF